MVAVGRRRRVHENAVGRFGEPLRCKTYRSEVAGRWHDEEDESPAAGGYGWRRRPQYRAGDELHALARGLGWASSGAFGLSITFFRARGGHHRRSPAFLAAWRSF